MIQVNNAVFNTPPPPIVGQEIQNASSAPPTHQFQPLHFKPFKPPDGEFDGKRLRKSVMRKTVDYNSSVVQMLENRIWQRDERDRPALPPDICYASKILPPPAYLTNPINAVVSKFVRTSTNKAKCPVFCLAWTPEGRRLVTGASSGEFTLWNGLTFNFETILQAHDSSVRAMIWSHNDQWMVTGDTSGYVKYWQSNMNNVKMFQAHKDPVRGLSFSPNDQKFATGSDDGTVRLWDFFRCYEEKILRGHGADVKCVSWHPSKSLLASGSKDNQQPIKLWDPRTGTSLAKLHAHKSTVMDLKWNPNGNWLCSASRDHLLKLFDVRNFSTELQVFRGHKKEASCIAWHPQHEGLFASGGSDGSVLFWNVGNEKEVGAIESAHDGIIWDLAWHPLGHLLCSGSNDHTSKFWTRNRPGDKMRDKYNLNTLPPGAVGDDCIDIDSVVFLDDIPVMTNATPIGAIPGMGPDDKVEAEPEPKGPETIPGLDFDGLALDRFLRKTPYAKPIPKNFQAAWNAAGGLNEEGLDQNQITSWVIVESANLFCKPANLDGDIVITESGEELPPGSLPLSQIKANAIAYYGFYIPLDNVSGQEIQDAFAIFEEEEAISELTNDAEFARKLIREKKGLYNPAAAPGFEEVKNEEAKGQRDNRKTQPTQPHYDKNPPHFASDLNNSPGVKFSKNPEKVSPSINPWDLDHPLFKKPLHQNLGNFPFTMSMNQSNMNLPNINHPDLCVSNVNHPNINFPNFNPPIPAFRGPDIPFHERGFNNLPMPLLQEGPHRAGMDDESINAQMNQDMSINERQNGMQDEWKGFGHFNNAPSHQIRKGFRSNREDDVRGQSRNESNTPRDWDNTGNFRGGNRGENARQRLFNEDVEIKKEGWRDAPMPGQWQKVSFEENEWEINRDQQGGGAPGAWSKGNWHKNRGGRKKMPGGRGVKKGAQNRNW